MQTDSEALRALDDASLDRKHINVTVLAALGSFIDGYDLFILSAALLLIVPRFHLNAVQVGYLGSGLLAGSFVGALIFGAVADRLGRRVVFLIDLLGFVLFAILAAVSQNLVELLIFRILMGFAIGADMPTATVMIAENSPRRYRGRLTQNMIVFWFTGGVCAGIVGLLLLNFGGASAWRWMLLSGIVPAIILLILRRGVPETPRWLLDRQQRDTNKQKSIAEVKEAATKLGVQIGTEGNLSKGISTSPSPAPAWNKRLIGRAAFLAIGWLVLGIPATGTFLYTPTILHGLGLTSKTGSVEYAIGGFVVYVITALIVSLWLMEKWGRRPILIFFVSVSCLCWVALIFLGTSGVAPLIVALVTLAGATNLACGSAFWVLSSEVFPTAIRGFGSGIVISGGRLGGVISTFIFPSLIADLHLEGTAILMAVLLVILAATGLLLTPETRGKSLEEISGVEPNPALATN